MVHVLWVLGAKGACLKWGFMHTRFVASLLSSSTPSLTPLLRPLPPTTHPVSHAIVFAPHTHSPDAIHRQSAAARRDPAVAHTATHVGRRWNITASYGDNYG